METKKRSPTAEEISRMTEEEGWFALCKTSSYSGTMETGFQSYEVGHLYHPW